MFVDGRYTLQAKNESNKNFKIVNTNSIKPLKINSKIGKKLKIGFDPKLFSESNLLRNFQAKNTTLIPIEKYLVDSIWANKPIEQIKKFSILNSKDTGRKFTDKINAVCNILKKEDVS